MLSYRNLSESIITTSEINWTGNENQKELCIYGMEIMVSTIMNFSIISITSCILQLQIETIVYLLFFLPGRLFGGGGHAKNHKRCITYFCIYMFGMIKISKYIIPIWDYKVFNLMIIVVLIIILVLNYKFASNWKNETVRKQHRKYTLLVVNAEILMIVLLFICSLDFIQMKYYVWIATAAMSMQAFILLPRLNRT